MPICPTCGTDEPDLNGSCSAKDELICCGHPPEPGCGTVLTPHERHWYGTVCEQCIVRWGDRINEWKAGGEDQELDAMFGAPISLQ